MKQLLQTSIYTRPEIYQVQKNPLGDWTGTQIYRTDDRTLKIFSPNGVEVIKTIRILSFEPKPFFRFVWT